MGIIFQYLFIYASFFTANVISQYVNKRPWPTYSLHNMPRTSFTCQDKILGGYYADPETQCQMFHVCVKVAGVGVQDFRFLCPNETAFDQESQICADWGDADCGQATLYYGSDNFDLYRLGSGFESKRAPLAEEEESTFHLQRAETNDIRRSKQTVVDQRSRPDNTGDFRKNSNYNFGKFSDSTYQTKNSGTYSNTFDDNQKTSQKVSTTKKINYIKVTTPPPATTKLNSYQHEDELLRGSHSSNFFNNRNNGKDEDLVDFNNEPAKTQPTRSRQRGRNAQRRNFYNNNNILTSPSKPSTFTTSTTEVPRIVTEQKQSTFPDTKAKTQTLTLQTSFRSTDLSQYNNQEQFRAATEVPSSTQATFSYNLTPTKPQTQQKIQPTTYNPSNNGYKFKSTTSRYENTDEAVSQFSNTKSQTNQNPFYNTQFENNFDSFNQPFAKKSNPERVSNEFYNSEVTNFTDNLRQNNENDFNANKEYNKTPVRNDRRRIEQYDKPPNNADVPQSNYRPYQETKVNKSGEGRKPNNFAENQKTTNSSQLLAVRPLDPQKLNSAFNNQSNFTEGNDRPQNNNRRVKPEYNFQKLTTPPRNDGNYEQSVSRGVPTPFTNSPSQNILRNTSPSPPFNEFARQTSSLPLNQNSLQGSTPINLAPRGFSRSTPYASKPSSDLTTTTRKPQTNNYDKYQTVSRQNENYTPPSAIKKFSTLVPKDQYYPTTFKPTTYKKQIDNFNSKSEKPQAKFATLTYYSSTTSTTTQRPMGEPDEDDGQYHPELYEKDFHRNQYKTTKQKVQSPINQQPDFSEEDEFLKTAHSLNIAAGANQLRAEKAKQSSPKNLFKSSTTTSSKKPSPPTSLPSLRPKPKKTLPNEDTSYDYAYYDSNSGNPQDYSEYDVISEFGKTKRQ